jgi:chemotaxis signal transduction protein
MNRCSAWQLAVEHGGRAAIGQRELLHLMYEPITHVIPYSPTYCRRVLFWERSAIPVLDLGVLFGHGNSSGASRFVAIVGFQDYPESPPQFGALLLAEPPVRVDVTDEQACALPDALSRLRPLVCACFRRGADAVPVLDLRRLFNADLPLH